MNLVSPGKKLQSGTYIPLLNSISPDTDPDSSSTAPHDLRESSFFLFHLHKKTQYRDLSVLDAFIMRSLTVFLLALMAMVLGAQGSPNPNGAGPQGNVGHAGNHDGSSTSCDKATAHGANTAPISSGTSATQSSSSAGTLSYSGSTTLTTTITSTSTKTVTITATSSACALTGATTGIPLTTSPAATYANTTIALNTTTSTKHLTNVSNTTPATTAPNATVPKPTVSPAISGFKGVAAGLSAHSQSFVFGLGALVFMAGLMM